MNATQQLNQVQGPTEAEVLASRKSPPAIPPQEVNGVPQTDLPLYVSWPTKYPAFDRILKRKGP